MYDTETLDEYVEYTTSAAEIALSGVADAISEVHRGQQMIRGEVDELLAGAGLKPSTGGMPTYTPPPGAAGAIQLTAAPTADDDAVDAAYAESEIGRLGLDNPRLIDMRKTSMTTREIRLTSDRMYDEPSTLNLTAEQADAESDRLTGVALALSRKGKQKHRADLEHDLDEDENASDDSQPGKGGVDAVAARHGLYFGHGGPEKPQSGNRRGTRPSKSSFGQRERTLAR